MTRVKICGLTRREDALLAGRLGASFLGFVLAESPRRARPAEVAAWMPELRAQCPNVAVVGVFVRPARAEAADLAGQLGLDYVQVHGVEPAEATEAAWPRPLLLACAPERFDAACRAGPWGVLVDSVDEGGRGGTGRSFDWSRIAPVAGARWFLAGGLGPDNVGAAIGRLHPWGVDASSRLESAPGCKEPALLAAFFRAIAEADRQGGQDAPDVPDGPYRPDRLREDGSERRPSDPGGGGGR